jgi:predicted SnoaL-like aldol condensation-catalyzing enzyme
MSSEEENKALVRRFYAEMDAGNLDAMDDLVAEDYLDHNPPSFPGLDTGRAGLKQAFQIFWDATPGRHEIEDQVAEGDKVVTRLTAYGKHVGDLPGGRDRARHHRVGRGDPPGAGRPGCRALVGQGRSRAHGAARCRPAARTAWLAVWSVQLVQLATGQRQLVQDGQRRNRRRGVGRPAGRQHHPHGRPATCSRCALPTDSITSAPRRSPSRARMPAPSASSRARSSSSPSSRSIAPCSWASVNS